MLARIFPLLMFASVASADISFASDSCRFLPDSLGPLQDGQLFASGKSGWQTFDTLSELVARSPQEVEFAYVIGANGASDRAGVFVVKTNRPVASTDTEQLRNRVKLVRRDIVSDPGCAAAGLPNSETSISTQSFRDYHDFPPRATAALRQTTEGGVTEFDAVRAFHFEYRSARKRKCVRTDNDEYDDFPTNTNSNRAQFSFDKTVVAGGAYTVFRLFWVPASPFDGTAEHRVLVRKYATQGGLACVRFSVPLRSTDYSFRINDLEARVSESSNRRKDELARTWPPGR
ncbi:hypothetical protein [Bradyrhizobium sp. AZCC 2230]|uniref:hypothetical protein n=1 Tax=Bradyrhizobium sp. AZCC 2230 TaxID=3117021 RepID=UPI002FEEB5A8